jgi:hypothetical protein
MRWFIILALFLVSLAFGHTSYCTLGDRSLNSSVAGLVAAWALFLAVCLIVWA